MQMLNFASPKSENIKLKKSIIRAFKSMLNSDSYILGENVNLFEKEFASYIGTKYCVGVNSGTDSLSLALRALGITEGDEVILPAMTATATAMAILSVGARPVFVDIEKEYLTIDPSLIERAITSRTKAIIAVHLYGGSADLEKIVKICTKHSVYLIEDVAQACGGEYKGVKLGSQSIISCFSFYPTKNLAALGDGGALCTDSKEIFEKLTMMRQYGWDSTRISQIYGMNSRLDELQAAFLRIKLRSLDDFNNQRIEIASHYISTLSNEDILLPKQRMNTKHVYHLFPILVDGNNRSKILDYMQRSGIKCGIHYDPILPIHPSLNIHSQDKFPVASNLAKREISLPIFPFLEHKSIRNIEAALLRGVRD